MIPKRSAPSGKETPTDICQIKVPSNTTVTAPMAPSITLEANCHQCRRGLIARALTCGNGSSRSQMAATSSTTATAASESGRCHQPPSLSKGSSPTRMFANMPAARTLIEPQRPSRPIVFARLPASGTVTIMRGHTHENAHNTRPRVIASSVGATTTRSPKSKDDLQSVSGRSLNDSMRAALPQPKSCVNSTPSHHT